MPDIPILIPVHNRLKTTKAGIAVLHNAIEYYNARQPIYNFIMVIIDDGSTDGTSQWIEKHYTSAFIVKGDGNLWWSGAINEGIEFCLGNFKKTIGFLLWNDDLEIKEDYFLKFSDIINNPHFEKTIVASIVYYSEEKNKIFFQGAAFNFKTGKGYIINRDEIDTGNAAEITECQYTGGMGVYIPLEVLQAVGRFDNKIFPQYHGDADFTLRAKKAGFRIICHSNIKVWNDRKQTYHSRVNSFSAYLKTVTAFRSNYNLKRDIKFYTRHAPIHFAMWNVLRKHALHFRNNIIYGHKKN